MDKPELKPTDDAWTKAFEFTILHHLVLKKLRHTPDETQGLIILYKDLFESCPQQINAPMISIYNNKYVNTSPCKLLHQAFGKLALSLCVGTVFNVKSVAEN